jgi:flagellar biosynthesis/type III secretory pathway M-ring protein FliF/YscJ
MSAKDRTPTTRLLALAALSTAAGLLALRAYDVFGSTSSEPIGSPIERELTYLLEPITGSDRVRVTVSNTRPRQILVMVDGDVASDMRLLRSRVEDILVASIAFDTEADTLKLSQFPFARGVGAALTPLQIAELSGLGLLTLALLGLLLGRQSSRASEYSVSEPAPAPSATISRPAPRPLQMAQPDDEIRAAGTLAETKPNETANLVRGWLSYAED